MIRICSLELGNRITQEYQDMLGCGAEAIEIWKLISHCMREVFAELRISCIVGCGPYLPEDRPSSVSWGCIQGLNMTKEFYKLGFSAHPKMSHILNIHLCNNSIPKAKFIFTF